MVIEEQDVGSMWHMWRSREKHAGFGMGTSDEKRNRS